MKQKAAVYAPSYYSAFQCIADKCRHSCCIGWEIDIDSATYELYQREDELRKTVELREDGPGFALCADGRCPHLNADGLCRIILLYGEAYLSEICRSHPRFFNKLPNGRIEAGLGIVCEEACRMILEDGERFSLSKIEDACGACDDEGDGYDALSQRDRMLAMIEASGSYSEGVAALRAAFHISALSFPDRWLDRFLSLEILDPEWKGLLLSMKGRLFCVHDGYEDRCGKYYRRLLMYFIYRHVSVAKSEQELRARLAFSLLSAAVIRSLFEEAAEGEGQAWDACAPDRLIDFARRYSSEIEYSEDNTEELIFFLENDEKIKKKQGSV